MEFPFQRTQYRIGIRPQSTNLFVQLTGQFFKISPVLFRYVATRKSRAKPFKHSAVLHQVNKFGCRYFAHIRSRPMPPFQNASERQTNHRCAHQGLPTIEPLGHTCLAQSLHRLVEPLGNPVEIFRSTSSLLV